MPKFGYTEGAKLTIKNSPKTLGNQLLRWALAREFSVIRVAAVTGATRQTVYNWMRGNPVTNAYIARVEAAIEVLRATPSADEAWRILCRRFNLNK